MTANLYSIEVTAALTCAHIQEYSAELWEVAQSESERFDQHRSHLISSGWNVIVRMSAVLNSSVVDQQ